MTNPEAKQLSFDSATDKSPLGQKPTGHNPTGQNPTAKFGRVDKSPLFLKNRLSVKDLSNYNGENILGPPGFEPRTSA